VISGYSDKEMVAGLLKEGRIGYLEKPFEPDELLRHVALLIERVGRACKEGKAAG
jgi:FixJ family two-component response regulator